MDVDRISAALERSRDLGLIGTTVEDAIERSLLYVEPLASCERLVDLGSGGGIPGLVVAAALPACRVTLLDVSARRCDHLRRLVILVGLDDRVMVVEAEAQAVGRRIEFRHRFDGVMARSFASPAVVAECAAPLLNSAGVLVVSSSPDDPADRWPEAGVGALGLRLRASVGGIDILDAIEQCSVRFPRKRADKPLF